MKWIELQLNWIQYNSLYHYNLVLLYNILVRLPTEAYWYIGNTKWRYIPSRSTFPGGDLDIVVVAILFDMHWGFRLVYSTTSDEMTSSKHLHRQYLHWSLDALRKLHINTLYLDLRSSSILNHYSFWQLRWNRISHWKMFQRIFSSYQVANMQWKPASLNWLWNIQ